MESGQISWCSEVSYSINPVMVRLGPRYVTVWQANEHFFGFNFKLISETVSASEFCVHIDSLKRPGCHPNRLQCGLVQMKGSNPSRLAAVIFKRV